MNTAPHAATLPFPRLRRFGLDVAIVAVFNVVIALIITYVIRLDASLFTNLVISMCIGLLAVSFIDGARLLLWPFRRPPALPFALLLLVSVPAAQYFGNRLAAFILDLPADHFASTPSRSAISVAAMVVLICLGITWFFWNRERMEHLKAEAEAERARAAEVEKQAMQAQLQTLQAQIEPHMLFNTLANLQGLIAVDAARAQNMLDQLIQYLRATLSSSRAQATTLEQEFALLDAYLGLMKVRMEARLQYRLDLPESLCRQRIPPMLLQPLVENAIKHGLEPKIEGGRIEVSAAQVGDALVLTVADTGLGKSPASSATAATAATGADGSGVGLNNARERLHVLYGDRARLDLEANNPCGLRARLSIPL